MGRFANGTSNPRAIYFGFFYNRRVYDTDGSSQVVATPALFTLGQAQATYLGATIATAEQLQGVDLDTTNLINPPIGGAATRTGTQHGKIVVVETDETDIAEFDTTRFASISFQAARGIPNEYIANWLAERNADATAPANTHLLRMYVDGGRRFAVAGAPAPFPVQPPAA